MTDLQKQNFEHTQRELAEADRKLAVISAEHKEKRETIEFLQRQVEQLEKLFHEAYDKAEAARKRFRAVVEEIAPMPKVMREVNVALASGGFVASDPNDLNKYQVVVPRDGYHEPPEGLLQALRAANPGCKFVVRT